MATDNPDLEGCLQEPPNRDLIWPRLVCWCCHFVAAPIISNWVSLRHLDKCHVLSVSLVSCGVMWHWTMLTMWGLWPLLWSHPGWETLTGDHWGIWSWGGHWPLAVRVRAFCLLKAWPGSAASLGLQKFTQTHELNLHKQIECHAFRRSITIGLETRYYCPLGLREKEVSTLIITPCKGYLGPKPLIINVSQIMRLDKHKRLWVSCEGRIKWSRLTPVTITPGTVSNDVWDWDSLEMDPKRLHL